MDYTTIMYIGIAIVIGVLAETYLGVGTKVLRGRQ